MSKSSPWILGISSSHNASVCLLKGDEIVVAIQEERLSRFKRHRTFGSHRTAALEYCLDYAGIRPAELGMVVHCNAFGRRTDPLQDVRKNPYLNVEENSIPFLDIPHHFAHGISAFATSGFDEAAVLVIDGQGSPSSELFEAEKTCCIDKLENASETISLYAASRDGLLPLEKHLAGPSLIPKPVGMRIFRSLGTIFSSSALQIFGDVNEAGKVMGLAPYGEQEFGEEDFFQIVNGCFRFQDKITENFDFNDRWPLRQREYMNLAASAQFALESAILYLVSRLHSMCPSQNLCYAGGVALNSVANERIIRESEFRNVYIVPAAEDSGPAIGAAYFGLWQVTKKNLGRKLVHDAVGRPYCESEIIKAIEGAPSIRVVDSEDVISDAVDLICEEKIIGWFQGRSELGPRALGQRSIICDPRRPEAKEILNARVKHREPFRPFAPAVLCEEAKDWFDFGESCEESPFMLRVCPVQPGKAERVPAIVHVDGTGRVQTLTKEGNGKFYELVRRFYERTGVPMLLNTSFNTMGEPIVETPQDALLCLLSTGLDYCVLENKLVTKKRDLEYRSVTALQTEVASIKERLADVIGTNDPRESSMKVRMNQPAYIAAVEEIHQASLLAISAFRDEVKEHLGTLTPDMEPHNAVRPISDFLSRDEWEALEGATRSHLATAAMINSLYMRYGGARDWACAIVHIFLAIETELHAKLVAPFLKWTSSQYIDNEGEKRLIPGLSVDNISPANEADVMSTGRRPEPGRIPLDSGRQGLAILLGQKADQGADDTPVNQLQQFTSSFDSLPLKHFFESFNRRLKVVVDATENALLATRASREDTIDVANESMFFLKHLPLIPARLPRIFEYPANTANLLGSALQT